MISNGNSFADHSLTATEVNRYSRQLLLPEIGVKGQEALKNGKVLVVGAGGLGCPVVVYLAAAGVGDLGIVDYDQVELNNLHRQIGHNEGRLRQPKAESLKQTALSLNSSIKCTAYNCQLLDRQQAVNLVKQYDVVCDCTDNVPSRYMLNDACVEAGKPLISGSALRWEGQLTVYNYDQETPCYRCLFPRPPPPETVTSCAEGGVLGSVCGIIGSLQALEVVKILTGIGPTHAGKLLLFNGLTCEFRPVKIRKRNPQCESCGSGASREIVNYEDFCCSKACDKVTSLNLLRAEDRVTVKELYDYIKNENPCLLLDCRPSNEYEICRMSNSINLPLSQIESDSSREAVLSHLRGRKVQEVTKKVFVICHRGNDSQKAVLKLRELLNLESIDDTIIKDIRGGLTEWSEHIDPSIPMY